MSEQRAREVMQALQEAAMANLERLQAGETITESPADFGFSQDEIAAVTDLIRKDVEAHMIASFDGDVVAWKRYELLSDAMVSAAKDRDRAMAVVMGAVVEERLKEAILRQAAVAGEQVAKAAQQLVATSGPAGAFASKVDVGVMMGLYGEPAWRALRTVVRIRNAFAHQLEIKDFADDGPKALAGNLTYLDQFLDYREAGMVKLTYSNGRNTGKIQHGFRLEDNPFTTARGRYFQTCAFLAQALLQLQPGAREPDLHGAKD